MALPFISGRPGASDCVLDGPDPPITHQRWECMVAVATKEYEGAFVGDMVTIPLSLLFLPPSMHASLIHAQGDPHPRLYHSLRPLHLALRQRSRELVLRRAPVEHWRFGLDDGS